MPQKTFKKDGQLFDSRGTPLMELNSDLNKNYAVITKCGHCGDGYYIPIIFTAHCKDVYTAIEIIKTIPRVKRDKKDAIIDAFEVTPMQAMFIDAINDRDPYLRGYFDKDTPELQVRRVANELRCAAIIKNNEDSYSQEELKNLIGTADTYHDAMVLQRYYAPIFQGNRLIFNRKINRTQMLDEFFTQAALRQGVRKGNVFFMSLYYQMYGKNNELGLVYDNGWFVFREYNGKLHSFTIPDEYHEKLEQSGVLERDKAQEMQEKITSDESERRIKVPSALEKFNRRMDKFRKKNQDPPPPPDGPSNG